MKTSHPDILVAGAGPAGLAAALTLQRYTGASVCVLGGEEAGAGAPRPGETVSRAIVPLLDYLGAGAILDADCALEGYGSEAAWGSPHVVSRDAIFSARGAGLHLDRRRFDAALAARFEAQGGRIVRGACLRHAVRSGDGWALDYSVGSGSARVLARQVIDASGRRAAFIRRIGIPMRRFDALVGVTLHAGQDAGARMPRSVLVEAVADGWWYSAPLPGQRAVFAFMTDADLLARARLNAPQDAERRLAAAPATLARWRACRDFGAPRTCQAGTQTPAQAIGPGWLAAGDAAMALDPLSSIGIGHALASGIHAARIAHARLKADEELAHNYGADIARHLGLAAAQWRDMYRHEQRWPQAPFWRRRHAPAPV